MEQHRSNAILEKNLVRKVRRRSGRHLVVLFPAENVEFSVVGFDVFTAVIMKSSVFWDITLCSPLKVNRRFGETYRLHLQSSAYYLLSCWFLAWFILRS
jgi:hypothetical protein